MAVTRETLRLAGDLRIVLDAHVDQATRDLVAAWSRAWQNLVLEWGLAYQPLIAAQRAGEKPTRAQIMRARRTTNALIATRRALTDLAERARLRILQPVDTIVSQAAAGQNSLLNSQMPDSPIARQLRDSLARVDQKQLEAIVARTTQQITTLATALQPLGMQAINAELVRGIALGLNPRTVARSMVTAADLVANMERAFHLPLNRAMVIARTEMLDAHRVAAAAGQSANSDVLQGWQWSAQLDSRTCPSCWGRHGSMHALSEPGPLDHQQGRCARLPVLQSWSDLGFDIIEPASVLPDAQQAFAALSKADQLKIMGPDRLAALQSGDLTWDGLSTRRRTPGWRDSYAPTPVSRIRTRRAA